MIDLAYVQKIGPNSPSAGEYINETAFSFASGCRLMGIEVIPFTAEGLDSLELRKDTLVHGWVGSVRRALKKLGVPEPHVDGMPPESLKEFYGRKMWATNMLEVRRRMDTDNHIFIKPLNSQKAFTGHVTSGRISDLIQTSNFEDDFKILASEVVDFVSEYRLFVNKRVFIGCRHYRGDWLKYPDFDIAFKCLEAWKEAPISYSLDLGITREGKTLVVEVNDAFALGAYGLPSIPYTQLVIDRWEEMVR